MTSQLTTSYLNTHDPDHPVQDDLVIYQLFEKARKEGNNGELVTVEYGERMSAMDLFEKADGYAKGLIALGLIPGEDILTVVGCASLESACLFTAAISIGVGYAHPYIYHPLETSICNILPLLEPKVLIVGEGASGHPFTALMSMFNEDSDTPESAMLPSVKYMFYDDSCKNRSPTQKFLSTLDKLRQLGESITDDQLIETRRNVKPEFAAHHVFTSGSTGKPKCIAHTHRGLANDILQLRADNVGPAITMNMNIDEMISYTFISWVLAGKISKTVFTPDIVEDLTAEEMARQCAEALITERVEYLALNGTVEQLMRTAIGTFNINIPPMKMFTNGAQLISRQFKEDLMKAFKGIPFTTYGTSETFILAFTRLGDQPADLELMLEARLYPKPNIELRLVDENNKIVDIGVDGEIQVKTYSIMKHYRGEPEKTRAIFTDDGFFRTGDIGVMHSDGSFIIKGRTADSIRFKVYGDVIYPGPVEEVIAKYPGFRDVSVVTGNTNDMLGDELAYCIMLEPGASKPTEEDLLSYCEDHGLNESQMPARIIYFESFPTTANVRKVSKKLLRDEVRKLIKQDSQVGITEWFSKFQKDVL